MLLKLVKMKRIFVSDIMTRSPIKVSPDVTIMDCVRIMVRSRVGSLLITDKKKLVGFISRRDVLWVLVKKPKDDLKKIKAIDISPRKLATLKPTYTISQAINKMKSVKFGKLPVIHRGELVGMLTVRDILNFHPEVYPELEELRLVREEEEKIVRHKKAQLRKTTQEGICEECGNFDQLYRVGTELLCESCKHLN